MVSALLWIFDCSLPPGKQRTNVGTGLQMNSGLVCISGTHETVSQDRRPPSREPDPPVPGARAPAATPTEVLADGVENVLKPLYSKGGMSRRLPTRSRNIEVCPVGQEARARPRRRVSVCSLRGKRFTCTARSILHTSYKSSWAALAGGALEIQLEAPTPVPLKLRENPSLGSTGGSSAAWYMVVGAPNSSSGGAMGASIRVTSFERTKYTARPTEAHLRQVTHIGR